MKNAAPTMILMPEKRNPLVYLDFAFKSGSLRDPEGKSGTASLTASMLLRGTKRRPAKEFHAALDTLGAEIHLGKYKESVRIHGTVLADKLDPFVDLIEEMLIEPSFSEEEFKKLREQFRSSLLDELGSDDDIADRRFQEFCLMGNPYGKLTSGSLESIDAIKREDLVHFHREYFRKGDVIVGAAGGFAKAALSKRLKSLLAKLPGGSAGRLESPPVVFPEKKATAIAGEGRPDAKPAPHWRAWNIF